MAYDKDQLFKEAIEIAQTRPVLFIEDVVALLPVTKATFYYHFKYNSDELNAIKAEINKNKVKAKVGLRAKWRNSDNPTLQISLYKLLSNDLERKMLSQQYHDITTDDKPITTGLDLSKLSVETLLELKKLHEESEQKQKEEEI